MDWWCEKIGTGKLGKTLFQKCSIDKSGVNWDENQCEVQDLSWRLNIQKFL